MKLPYGISNFARLIEDGYFYVDKTRYIEQLENEPAPYIFFLRPRRFGKTLFVSMLRYYYGLEHQEQFDSLFGKYYIGAHPTSRAHSYHVLKFDFSRIGTSTPETTQSGFQQNVLIGVKDFEKRYDGMSQDYTGYENPSDALKEFFTLSNSTKNMSKSCLLPLPVWPISITSGVNKRLNRSMSMSSFFTVLPISPTTSLPLS